MYFYLVFEIIFCPMRRQYFFPNIDLAQIYFSKSKPKEPVLFNP